MDGIQGASVENYHFLKVHIVFLPLCTEQDSRASVSSFKLMWGETIMYGKQLRAGQKGTMLNLMGE